ncbi:MAG: hypothetical protein APF77_00445 [Clostridia bacterium BRH_c25]|nr:MAG: hypothetical protein APF77_00445 [Clostridia bacterium BRH_c25]
MIKVDNNTVKFEGYELENLVVLLEQVVGNSIIDTDSREFAISFLRAFITCFGDNITKGPMAEKK